MSSLIRNSTATNTYRIPFAGIEIKTMVTKEAGHVNAWIESIRSEHDGTPTIVGLDCEWKPNQDPWHTNKVATLQLCIANKCIIIQLFYMDHVPRALKSFMSDINYTFVGIKVGDDIAKLASDYGLRCRNQCDLGPLCIRYVGSRALMYEKPQLGLKDYAWEVLRVRMEKPLHVSRSNWEVRELSMDQIGYACIDAYVSYKLGGKLMRGN